MHTFKGLRSYDNVRMTCLQSDPDSEADLDMQYLASVGGNVPTWYAVQLIYVRLCCRCVRSFVQTPGI